MKRSQPGTSPGGPVRTNKSASPQNNGWTSFYIVVESPSSVLTLEQIGRERLGHIVRRKLPLRWDCQGDVRLVPRSVLVDLHRLAQDQERGAVPWLKAIITWDQTVPLPQPDMALDVIPAPRQRGGSAGGVDTPAQ